MLEKEEEEEEAWQVQPYTYRNQQRELIAGFKRMIWEISKTPVRLTVRSSCSQLKVKNIYLNTHLILIHVVIMLIVTFKKSYSVTILSKYRIVAFLQQPGYFMSGPAPGFDGAQQGGLKIGQIACRLPRGESQSFVIIA